MEELKAYIESGILELYVLGQLGDQEKHEVEAMAAKYPEVKQEIKAIEIGMEQYALAQGIEPSEGLDQKIIQKIASLEATKPAEPTPNLASNTNEAPIEARILPLPRHTEYNTKIRNLRIALIACSILLAISIAALFTARSELGNAKEQIAKLSAGQQQFTIAVSHMKQMNADLQKIIDMRNDPDWKTVALAGTAMNPDAKMVVYWHTTGKHVMMDNSKMGLPINDKDHQYQLWALVDGKPVDLGVFDVNKIKTTILLNMKEIAGAQTFAVTLEKRGGSPAPTLDKMIVAGNVSI